MLALASGLAEAKEPADEIARVGAAYLALLRAPERERAARPLAVEATGR